MTSKKQLLSDPKTFMQKTFIYDNVATRPIKKVLRRTGVFDLMKKAVEKRLRTNAEVIRELKNYIGEATCIVEIGAHKGEDTRTFRKEFPEAHIIAIEPDEKNAEALMDKMSGDTNIQLICCAIGEKNEPVTFYKRKDDSTHSTMRPVQKDYELETVNMHTMDYLGVDIPIDLIWCDIEGAESRMIKGATHTLKKTRWLYLEYHDEILYEERPTLDDLIDLLPGFDFIKIYGDNALFKRKEQ